MGDLVQMNCPTCGGKLEIQKNSKSAVCQYCGNEHLIKPTEGDIPQDTYAKCPLCKKDDKVEKVTAIIRLNTEKSANKSEYQLSGLAARLSPPDKPKFVPKPKKQKLNFPQKKYFEKNYNQFGLIVLVLGILLFSCMGLMILVEPDTLLTAILLLSVGIIVLGIHLIKSSEKRRKDDEKKYIIKCFLENQKMNKKLQEEYEKRLEEVRVENEKIKLSRPNALKRWERLYYCYRDDCVFIPGEGSYSCLSEIKDYIYQT